MEDQVGKVPNATYKIHYGGGQYQDMFGKKPNVFRRLFIRLLLGWEIV